MQTQLTSTQLTSTQLTSKGTAYWLSASNHQATSTRPTIVLIHGIGLSHKIWAAYTTKLSEQYQVLAYDLLGHGQSAPASTAPNLTRYAEQLLDLLNELNIAEVYLIGFSLGGMINRRFAMDYPQRVAGLIILNSPHERTPEAQALVEQRAKDTDAGGAQATMPATLARWFTEAFCQQHPVAVEEVAQGVLANDPVVYAQARQVLATGVIELIRPLQTINTPTLVITCANDSGSTPAMSQAIGQEIMGAKVVIIPQLKHMGLVEQPKLFLAQITVFLTHLLAQKKA